MKWDGEMMELQVDFSRVFLLQFCRRIHLPLWKLENKRAQNNDLSISEKLRLFDKADITAENAMKLAAEHNAELYIGELDVVIRPKKASSSCEVVGAAPEQGQKAKSSVKKRR